MLHLMRLFTPADWSGVDAMMMAVVVVEVKKAGERIGALVGMAVGPNIGPFFE